MDTAEEMNELRYRVVGNNVWQKSVFMDPANGSLVAGYLDPYRVDGVGGMDCELCDNEKVPAGDRYGVAEWELMEP